MGTWKTTALLQPSPSPSTPELIITKPGKIPQCLGDQTNRSICLLLHQGFHHKLACQSQSGGLEDDRRPPSGEEIFDRDRRFVSTPCFKLMVVPLDF